MKNFFSKIISFFKNEKDSIIKPTVVLLCICIIIPLALAVTNKVTVNRIAKLEQKAATETMAKLVKADKFTERNNKDLDTTYFEAMRDGNVTAFIFTTSAKGYGGDVKVMTSIAPDGRILNLAILDVSNETPGLGQNVTKPDFYSQFKGKNDKISFNDIDAVTSATYSSKAVLNAVNKAVDTFQKLAATPAALPEFENNEAGIGMEVGALEGGAAYEG